MGPRHTSPSTILFGLGALAVIAALGCQDDDVPGTTRQASPPPIDQIETGTQSETAKNRAGSTASQAQPYMAPEPLHDEQDGDASPPDPIVEPDEPRRDRPEPPEPDPYADGQTGGDERGSAPPPL